MSMTARTHRTLHARLRATHVSIAGLALVAYASTASSSSALAAASSGCSAANAGALNAEVEAAASVTRQVMLDTGDVLDFSARPDAAASVTLISGSGAPQSLVGGASAAAASFKAPAPGTYVFGFSAGPQASAQVRVACVSAGAAAANAAFLARRKDLLNAKDPDRIRIDRTPTPIANPDKPLASSVAVDAQGNPREIQFSVSLSEIQAAANPGQKPDPGFVDLWLEGRMQNYATGSADISNGNLGVLYLGTRTKLGPDILVGGLAQFDRGIENSGFGETQMAATGWMAGPYMSMKLGSGVVFDGRAAWGATENAVPGVTLSDEETGRRLVRAKLTGTRQVEGWKVAPSLGLVYLEDAVRDGESGDTKAEGTGRVELLPEVSRRFEVTGDTFVEPRAAVGGFVGFDHLSELEPMVMTGSEPDLHLKAEAGVAVGVKDGSRLEATGGVESSTTTTAPETWTGRLQLNVPLGK
jgi:hypothetical protein